ncbi:hypothetical protein HORIV_69760 [Vreelandella olivaria]|uniref:hydroxymethylpyrimidine kinase n=1 Tax=Vreelandella olivaria TaxID=390919 RepID=A0ABM7GUW8_9GAMM|nr:hypothetical protein HORIV_69760 [Halomonas olivaria]
MSTHSHLRNVLTIAGSDPSGGAGLQGDLKTFSALGVYGTNVITAVIAQNTCGVASVYPVAPQAIREQLEHLLDDVAIDAVKIGMVASREVAEVIADVLRQRRPRWIVLDPVMVAKSGDILVDDEGIRAVRDVLVPLADVITPNLPEAAVLLDTPLTHQFRRHGGDAAGLDAVRCTLCGAERWPFARGHLPGSAGNPQYP